MNKKITLGNWIITTTIWEELPVGTKYVKQTHGSNIVTETELRNGITEADGIITIKDSHPVAIKTADCLPLVITTDTKAISFHISRKTLINGILDNVGNQITMADITGIYIGPHICQKHFKFESEGDEIIRFEKKFPKSFTKGVDIHLSLRQAVHQYLDQWEVATTTVIEDTRCTYETKDLPSYRYALDNNTNATNLATIVSA